VLFRSWSAALLVGLLWSSFAWSGSDPVVVRVGVFENPPIVSASAGKPPAGIAIDVIRWVAEQEDWKPTYVHGSWDELIARLDHGDIDLLVGIAYSDARATRFQFSRQSLLGNWGIVFSNADARIDALPDLKGKRVALMRGSTHSQALVELSTQFDAAFTPVYVDSYEQVLHAVSAGHVDAGAVNRVFGALHAQQPGLLATSIVFNPVFVHYAAPKRADPAVLDALDRHLAELKADTHSMYYASLRTWLEAASVNPYSRWLPWTAGAAGGLLLLALTVAGFLRRQVARQTGELQRRAEQLQSEIEQREQAQAHLNQLAYYDALTGLPNREGFAVALNHALAEMQRGAERLALLFIDVDRLKNVNDGLGHGAGDMLLKQIAHFFEHYKDLEDGKWVKVEGWTGVDDARAEILAGVERYRNAADKPAF